MKNTHHEQTNSNWRRKIMLKPLYCSKEKINKYSTNHTKSEEKKKKSRVWDALQSSTQANHHQSWRPRLPKRETEGETVVLTIFRNFKETSNPLSPSLYIFQLKTDTNKNIMILKNKDVCFPWPKFLLFPFQLISKQILLIWSCTKSKINK